MTVDEFIAEWGKSGGNERANTHLFVNALCNLIGVEHPRATQSEIAANDYVFERNVIKTEIDGTTSNGWIDCYKRDCFILEAKQGSAADIAAVETGQGDSLRDFFGQTAEQRFKRGMAKRGTGQWTGAMQRAAGQAEGYAKALPQDHGWPPFLLVSDIGYCIDVYADFSRSGKGYAPYPDRRRFRITLDDLRDQGVRDRLKAIWEAPMSLDPSAEAARVTRGIADHLATLARRLEGREQNPDRVAAFLMRLLFTMFAEDTGLIPKKSFSALLKKVRERPENLPPMLTDLWAKMDSGGFVGALGEAGETVRRFNGYLFKETTALPLDVEEIDVLIKAAEADWRQVEPAIFGTLLERALVAKERAKLGAHYTPRAYVERLVGPTIMEPLRDDWSGSRIAATEAAEAGDKESARKIVEAFHGKLARTKVLDPACGTGNFLYVAMARMKELEGEVLELLEELGDHQYLAEISGHTITPENFLGIEINPRAANIAQLVLWIGYLQWHFRVNGEDRMPEAPVLRDVKTIENRDALITWDKRELERDAHGKPITRWDGETMKKHPVTGDEVPDEAARVVLYRYLNPRAQTWPKANFIIGNPPFVSSREARELLGDDYVVALRRAHPKVPGNVDLVMYFWEIGVRLTAATARRVGFITTSRIRLPQNREVVTSALGNQSAIVFAIPDHPWAGKDADAGVRVAFTVVTRIPASGATILISPDHENPRSRVADGTIVTEDQLRRVPRIRIPSDLSADVDVSDLQELRCWHSICSAGMKPYARTLIVSHDLVGSFDLNAEDEERYAPRYLNGQDVARRSRQAHVLDLNAFSTEQELASSNLQIYNYVLSHTKPERSQERNPRLRSEWWRFEASREELRKALAGIARYIVTVENSPDRYFVFVDAKTLPDQKLRCVGSDDAFVLGVLSTHAHEVFSKRVGGRHGVGNTPVYNTKCTTTFPFPGTSDEALKDRIRDAAEKLDALRKDVLARHEDLTLTKLYNVLEALRAAEKAGTVLSDKDRDIATRGCVSLIRQYHDTIDVAVAEAYGWPADLSDEEILERLVALNKERAAEEAKGQVRWLRPEFQQAGYVAPKEQAAFALPEAKPSADILEWPSALPDQVVAVAAIVERAARPIAANDVARSFKGKRAATVQPVLDALAGMGRLRKLDDGRFAA